MALELVDVGIAPKLFADDEVIEHMVGCVRRVRQVVKHAQNPVIFPAETDRWLYVGVWSVLYDDNARTYQMWYETHSRKISYLRYATSTDGVHWEFPNLGLCELDGSKDNNLPADSTGAPVPNRGRIYLNPDQSDPARKYVGLFQKWHYHVGYSADGVRWDIDFDRIVWERGSGDGLGECYFAMHDPIIAKWRAYVRVWTQTNSIRTSGYGESDDLTSWTGPTVKYTGDREWGLGSQIYDWTTWYDAGLYWAMPHMYHTDMHPDPRWQETTHLGLLFSRDGESWQAVDKSTDYIPLGQIGEFDSHGMYHYPNPIMQGDDVLFYYTGCNVKHDYTGDDRRTGIGLAVGRRGGYVCLQAQGDSDGVMMSKPFRLRGDQLLINAQTDEGGWVKAEFLNPYGQIIKTLDLAESCDAFTGDSTAHQMTWRGNGSLSRILGETARLRLRFRNAEVFGFRFGESKPGICELSEGPAPVRCGTTQSPPVIDGELSDTDWENFKIIGTVGDFVRHDRLEAAPVRTTVLAMHDAEAIYLGFDLEEPNMDKLAATCVQGDQDPYKDDCVQVEFQPDGPEGIVTVLYFTSSAVVLQMRTDPNHSHWTDRDSDPQWQAATKLAQTRWTAELKVPFTSLGMESPKPGDSWRFNVHRFRHAGGTPEIHSWICIFGSFSRHDRRGEIHFE